MASQGEQLIQHVHPAAMHQRNEESGHHGGNPGVPDRISR